LTRTFTVSSLFEWALNAVLILPLDPNGARCRLAVLARNNTKRRRGDRKSEDERRQKRIESNRRRKERSSSQKAQNPAEQDRLPTTESEEREREREREKRDGDGV
jgi:hypothetical protein